jgi:hypothetical protein
MADRGAQPVNLISKRALKQVLGELPFTAEVYWQLRQQGKPLSKSFSLRRVERSLPDWLEQVEAARSSIREGHLTKTASRRVMLFSTLRYWLEHATLLGLALSGLGHQVTLAYLPYANWRKPFNQFDLRRQNAYARAVLSHAAPLLQCVSLLDVKMDGELTGELIGAIRSVSLRDAQYTLQVENIDRDGSESESARLYRMRLERNTRAACAALAWMRSNRPEVVVLPNGSILEMGAVYQAARSLGIPVVTYEFGEQRGRIWLARNAEVMHQRTDDLWQARKDRPLNEDQWQQVRALFASRQHANLWENFSRRWQGQPSQGGEKARLQLGLDGRPILLLAANVIGDSLTLGRQVFSDSMTEWLERTVGYFASRPLVQMVVRIHPGERYTKGPSVADVIHNVLPDLPAHMRLVAAGDPLNTYDLVEIADLGLVYTTTVGMEMAMSGVPAIVVGQTHYRAKGFTLDPDSWDSYFALLEKVLADPAAYRPTRQQVEQAWNYAYRFFFEYPQPFPWHLVHFWDEMDAWPVGRVLSPQGLAQFGDTFRQLVGELPDWNAAG